MFDYNKQFENNTNVKNITFLIENNLKTIYFTYYTIIIITFLVKKCNINIV